MQRLFETFLASINVGLFLITLEMRVETYIIMY
jgi:hypothetical protein